MNVSINSRHEAGFTLLEVVVAFAILSLSFGVVLQLYSQGFRSADLSGQYTEATLVSQSVLAGVGSLILLEEGATEGDTPSGYRWQVDIVPFKEEDISELSASTQAQFHPALVTAYLVTVKTSWQRGDIQRKLELNTIRLGEAL